MVRKVVLTSAMNDLESTSPDGTEYDEWESSHWARTMLPERRQAARLVGEGVEDERIEDMLGLKRGELLALFEKDPNFKRACESALRVRIEPERRELDFSTALKPNQLKAAELYFVELKTQTQTARTVGVTDRTVWNWLKDPVFLEFGKIRQQAAALERDRERKEREIRFRGKRDAQVAKAQDVIDKALDRREGSACHPSSLPRMGPLDTGKERKKGKKAARTGKEASEEADSPAGRPANQHRSRWVSSLRHHAFREWLNPFPTARRHVFYQVKRGFLPAR
jgi:DNA-directed RNA polymerase specialized sigma24 family protein